MPRDIPRGSTRATIQFISNQPNTPTITVSFKLPRDEEDLKSILDVWYNRTSRETARVAVSEVVQKPNYEVSPIIPRVTRVHYIDLNTILFIEGHYYDDEPDQESP